MREFFIDYSFFSGNEMFILVKVFLFDKYLILRGVKMKNKMLWLVSMFVILLFVVSCAPKMTDEELSAELSGLSDEELNEVAKQADKDGTFAGMAVGGKTLYPASKAQLNRVLQPIMDSNKGKVCGDGIKGKYEECDLGNDNGVVTKTCSNNCLIWKSCTTWKQNVNSVTMQTSAGPVVFNSACNPVNNSLVVAMLCNGPSYDTKNLACGQGMVCQETKTGASCVKSSLTCGNAKVGVGEQCDDGNKVDTDSCTNKCTSPMCGDGVLQLGEQCDDGNVVDFDGCTNKCTSHACGDGALQSGEQCDDSNVLNGDGCSNTCQTELLPFCGNGKMDVASEQCDDGNVLNGDGCSSTCQAEQQSVCGNNIKEGTEVCDGNQLDGKTCKDFGFGSGTLKCAQDCKSFDFNSGCSMAPSGECGNKIQEGAETCDDGNKLNGDGCSSTCQTEQQQQACTPGQYVCDSVLYVKQCNHLGEYNTPFKCAEGEMCSNGNCVVSLQKPDLVVSNVSFSLVFNATSGKNDVMYNVTLKNKGAVNSGFFSTKVQPMVSGMSASANFFGDSIAAGKESSTIGKYQGELICPGTHTLNVTADINWQVAESNEYNNNFWPFPVVTC